MKITISPQQATILISFQWFKSFAQTLKELVVVGTVVSYEPLTNVYLQIQTQGMGYKFPIPREPRRSMVVIWVKKSSN